MFFLRNNWIKKPILHIENDARNSDNTRVRGVIRLSDYSDIRTRFLLHDIIIVYAPVNQSCPVSCNDDAAKWVFF